MRTTFIIIQFAFMILQLIMMRLRQTTVYRSKGIMYLALSYVCSGIVFGMMIAVIVSGIYDLGG